MAALRDTEALAIDRDGTLWVADTGDNCEQRDDAALYALPEQGPAITRSVPSAIRSRTTIRLPNVEALLVHPVTGAKFLVSKALLGGTIYALPTTLSTERANVAVAQPGGGPSIVTDATFTRRRDVRGDAQLHLDVPDRSGGLVGAQQRAARHSRSRARRSPPRRTRC